MKHRVCWCEIENSRPPNPQLGDQPTQLRHVLLAEFEFPKGIAQVLEKTMARLSQPNRA